jgi:hypothetical protein
MAIKTYIAQLEEIQTAITQILTGGQAYTISGRALTRGDLATLYAQEKRLMPLAIKENSGRTGPRVRGITPVDC